MNKAFMPSKHRQSIRLPEFDYSQDGAYFITIVAQKRACLFGTVADDEMILNDAGWMIDQVCREIPRFIQCVGIDAYQIMPNHFHAIIILAQQGVALPEGCYARQTRRSAPTEGRLSLYNVVQRFKSLTTRRYIDGVRKSGWPRFDSRLWQRNYYEHVLRNERDYQAIVNYISCNPQNWERDEEFQ